ncbi:MAG: hypothetical protein JST40_01205 [Armatimonadetes bacterium]|nr:hypothetical protein [Armatimonadota bacterium]
MTSIKSVRLIAATACLASVALGGCHFTTLPDPNDPANAATLDGAELQRVVAGIYDNLAFRQGTKEITEEQLRSELKAKVDEYLTNIDLESIPVDEAWQYADVLRTAKEWDLAEPLLKVAVKFADSADRKVNDTLRLAQAQAHLNKVDEAIRNVWSTMDTPPGDKGAILPAMLYEIAPALIGKGRDVEVAKLLEAAVQQHLKTVVDPSTRPGRDFLRARSHHIRNAFDLAISLYGRSDHFIDADRAKGRKMATVRKLWRGAL